MSNSIKEESAVDHGLPSVNDRNGTASRSIKSKVIGMLVLASMLAMVVGASYYGLTRLKRGVTGHDPKQEQEMTAQVKPRTFDTEVPATPPALPASLSPTAPVPASATDSTAVAQAKPIEVVPMGQPSSHGPAAKPEKIISRYDWGILTEAADGQGRARPTPVSADANESQQGGFGGLQSGAGSGTGEKSGGALGNGLLTATKTPLAVAGKLANLSMTMPKTTPVLCSLRTAINSGRAGQSACVVMRDVLSADAKVVLVDRGSNIDLEYGPVTKQGEATIGVLASRIRTPQGVVIDIGSLATDQLGRSGVPGYVDNHWGQRIGGALLLAMIQDGMSYATTRAQSGSSGTVIYQGTSDTTDKMAEKVLDSTINIPPTILKNQGEVISIELSRDLDFSHVYSLAPN
jgi:type IV secretion system protein VirB10